MTSRSRINFYITPGGSLQGDLQIPGDKSISHRALIMAAIATGKSNITGFLDGEDTLATLSVLESLGIRIERINNRDLTVYGSGLHGLKAPVKTLDLGNSGTGVRLLAGLLAGQSFDSELTGDESLKKRPMQRITDPLRKMNAAIQCSDQGTLPLRITGGRQLKGINYTMPVASAQVKTCLFMAGLYAEGKTCIREPAITRDHTERLFDQFGCKLEKTSNQFCIHGGSHLKGTTIHIPADISSAAFFMVAASVAPGSNILLRQIGVNPTRDAILKILCAMGANINLENKKTVSGEPVADIRVDYSQLRGINIPLELVSIAIDEFPAILIAAANAEGKTVLRGASELRVKESDRITAMTDGLNAIGIRAIANDDGIEVIGGEIRGGVVNSHGDHRIAMAFAMAGLTAINTITVQDCRNVETSFPGFVNLAAEAGVNIMVQSADDC